MQGFNSDSTRRADSQDAQKPCDLVNNESYWRNMYAGMAMQGFCVEYGVSTDANVIARWAVECADALIAELKKKK